MGDYKFNSQYGFICNDERRTFLRSGVPFSRREPTLRRRALGLLSGLRRARALGGTTVRPPGRTHIVAASTRAYTRNRVQGLVGVSGAQGDTTGSVICTRNVGA
jgi:hypothetical protein